MSEPRPAVRPELNAPAPRQGTAPAARLPVRFQLCVISDGRGDAARLLTTLEAALRAAPPGAVAVQLRERTLSGAALLALAERLRVLTTRYGAALLINDRLDIALLVGADGVHLPGHGLPPQAARFTATTAGARLLVSVACHSLDEAHRAVADGADLITFGPIWPTPSKPEVALASGQLRVHPVGVPTLAQVTAAMPVPVFALGGVDDAARAAQCALVGARVAGIRAVLSAPDPAAAVHSLLAALQR
ncbi:MAG: thiamine phosphate synthase [Pseudoxanthomonas sp.]